MPGLENSINSFSKPSDLSHPRLSSAASLRLYEKNSSIKQPIVVSVRRGHSSLPCAAGNTEIFTFAVN